MKLHFNSHAKWLESFCMLLTLLFVFNPAFSFAENVMGIKTESECSEKYPYIGQTIVCKTRLITTVPLRNVQFQEFKASDLNIKPYGDFKSYEAFRNKEKVHILELQYIATPLKSGKIHMQSQKLTGEALLSQLPQNHNNNLSSLIFNQNALDGQSQNQSTKVKPFSINTSKWNLEVKQSNNTIKPWVVANSITIESKFDSEQFVMGRSYKREVTIKGRGIAAHQLPKIPLEKFYGDGYKIYLDQSTSKTEIDKTEVVGIRTEIYTITPQRPGNITLPAVTIKWWDAKNKTQNYSIIHDKSIDVLESDAAYMSLSNISFASGNLSTNSITQNQNQPDRKLLWILWLIVPTIILSFYLLWVKYGKYNFSIRDDKTGQLIRLDGIDNISKLYTFWQIYANKKWGTPANIPMNHIFDKINQYGNIEIDYHNFIKDIYDSIYGQNEMNQDKLNELKDRSKKMIFQINKLLAKKANKLTKQPRLTPLNPADK